MTAQQETFAEVYRHLHTVLEAYADTLVCTADTATDFALDTPHVMANGKPLFFGAVQVKKRYVSFHLMPVYVEPALLDNMSAALGKRMQGKSCFNFTRVDEALFAELAALAATGYELYRERGYLTREA